MVIAPVYLLAAFCGFRAWRFGENSSLISFLVLNILQLPLCPTELAFSAIVIVTSYYRRFNDYNDYDDMAVMNFVKATAAGLYILEFIDLKM